MLKQRVVLGLFVSLIILFNVRSTQAQELINWISPVRDGDLLVSELRGSSDFTTNVPTLTGILTNQTNTPLRVALVAGDIIAPQNESYCSFVLAGDEGNPLDIAPGASVPVTIKGYCLETSNERVSPDSSVLYSTLKYVGEVPEATREVLRRAKSENLVDSGATQIAVWRAFNGWDNAALASAEPSIDSAEQIIERFGTQVDYLVGEIDQLQPEDAAPPAEQDETGTTDTPVTQPEATSQPSVTRIGNLELPFELTPRLFNIILAILIGLLAIIVIAMVVVYLRGRGGGQQPQRPSRPRPNRTTPIARVTPTTQAGSAENEEPCLICGLTGHKEEDCPTRIRRPANPFIRGTIDETVGKVRSSVLREVDPATAPSVRRYASANPAPPSGNGGRGGESIVNGKKYDDSHVSIAPSGNVRPIDPNDTTPGGSSGGGKRATSFLKDRRHIEYSMQVQGYDDPVGSVGDKGGMLVRSSLKQNQLVLDNPIFNDVSTPHALLRFRSDRVTIKDLRSLNGTRVYGNLLPPGGQEVIADGAHIQLGESAEFLVDIHNRKLISLNPQDDQAEYSLPLNPQDSKNVLITRRFLHEIVVPQSSISTPHLLITPDEDNLRNICIRDLGSVNGARIGAKDLHQLINATYIGPRHFNFVIDNRTYTLEARRQHLPDMIDGQYRVIDQVYESGMAEIFKVEDNSDGAIKVAKVLAMDQDKVSEARYSFRREIGLMEDLSKKSEHILPVYAKGNDAQLNKAPYFIMPLLSGGDLSQISRQINRDSSKPVGLRLSDILAIYNIILPTLEMMHTHDVGYIHCDVKPHNVYLTTDGKVYLLDLGVVTQRGQRAEFGTAAYSAPEVLVQDSAVFETADIYSLGAMLFELLTGRSARALYMGHTLAAGLHTVGTGAMVSSATRSENWEKSLRQVEYGMEFKDVIEKAIKDNAADRYANVHEFRQALDKAFLREKAKAVLQREGNADLAKLAFTYVQSADN